MNDEKFRQWIDDLIDNDISEADFLKLEAELHVNPEAREAFYKRMQLSTLLEITAECSPESNVVLMPKARSLNWRWIRGAAAAVFVLGSGILMGWMAGNGKTDAAASKVEPIATGFAVIAEQSNAVWRDGETLRKGELLPAGELRLISGAVQLELFSGATVVVEGEAQFEVVSPMEMNVALGKVRASVPEPAQGFRIRTADGEIVDLGTEFAVNVSDGQSEVHVLDGEVEWHPRHGEKMRRLTIGDAVRTSSSTGASANLAANATDFLGVPELRERQASNRLNRREEWFRFSGELQKDPRLVAYYRMGTADGWNRRIPNLALVGAAREGAIVAAARTTNRWGEPAGALDFSPTGSRVRLSVPGEYRSLTLLCWVRINSLDRWYNSLFLTDGHEQFEPHWQIMEDGRLFFSVKKRDRWDPKKGEKDKHIYFSPKFWNASLSGQWLMIATVYDVDARQVTHYLNGKALGFEAIPAEYLVETVRIGNASLANWGLPERDEPRFAVRNLNGSMDEFALFSAALPPSEIEELYELGKP